jgi:hypothetical protein
MVLSASFLRDDYEGSLAIVGADADRLLPIVLGVLTGAIKRLVSHEELVRDVERWLDRHRDQLARSTDGTRRP